MNSTMPGVVKDVGMEDKSTSMPPEAPALSFWSRLAALPLIAGCQQSLEVQRKQQSWVGVGMEMLGTGISMVAAPVIKTLADTFPGAVAELDKAACHLLGTMENKTPILNKTPDEAKEDVKISTKVILKKVFKTYPGRKLLKTLDAVTTVSEKMLDMIAPVGKVESAADGEDEAAVKEEGEESSDTATQTSSSLGKLPQTLGLQGVTDWILETKIKPFVKLTRKAKSELVAVLVVTPLKNWVLLLKWIRRFLPKEKLKPRKPKLTPEKAKEIEHRRKASPKKRVKKSLIYRSVGYLLNMLGLSKVTRQMDIRLYMTKTDDSEQSACRHDKRKHDDVGASSSDESDTMQLGDDLDDYRSDEDPDYKPEEQKSEDSLEFGSGDTESDIEEELQTSPSKRSTGLVQIKGGQKMPPKNVPGDQVVNGTNDVAKTSGGQDKTAMQAKEDVAKKEQPKLLAGSKPLDIKLSKIEVEKSKGTEIH